MYGEKLNGKIIKYYTYFENGNEIRVERNSEYKMVYEFDYRGEYGMGWIVVYKEDKAMSMTSDKNIFYIEFEEAI